MTFNPHPVQHSAKWVRQTLPDGTVRMVKMNGETVVAVKPCPAARPQPPQAPVLSEPPAQEVNGDA